MIYKYRDFSITEWINGRYSASIDKSEYERHYIKKDATFVIQTRNSLDEFFYVNTDLSLLIDELECALSVYYGELVDFNINRTKKVIV